MDWLAEMTPGVALAPDGRTLATSSFIRATPRIWNIASGELVRHFKKNDDSNATYCLAFSPDGRFLATGTWQFVVRIWDVDKGEEHVVLREGWYPVVNVAFSSDGGLFASAEGAGERFKPCPKVRIWDTATWREVASLNGSKEGFSAIAFSPKEKILATGSGDKTVKLWDLAKICPNGKRSVEGKKGEGKKGIIVH
jgi:WD40 repeat protein